MKVAVFVVRVRISNAVGVCDVVREEDIVEELLDVEIASTMLT